MNHRAAGVVFALLVSAATGSFAVSPSAPSGQGGAVASEHVLATEVGVTILSAGGNAVDAAVATALALAVTHPEAGNLGGGGFAVVRMKGEIEALDFRETGPAAAHRALFLDAQGAPIPGASQVGALAVGVPGSPTGLHELHRRHGRLPWSHVVAPAQAIAAEGFRVGRTLHLSLAEVDTRTKLSRFEESRAAWLPGGEPLPVGHLLRQPALARTLARYAAEGPRALTEGPVAAAVVAASSRRGGILTLADLASYRPAWREPLRFERLGWSFATMPLPSSGGVILGGVLAHLERWNWGASPRGGAERAHLLTEALRRGFADRTLLGDPASTAATPAELLAPEWLSARAATLDRSRATPSASLATFQRPAPTSQKRESTDTTHLSVIDRDGNAVALTTTLNDSYGSGLYVPEAGFFLNDEMDDFTVAPGVPNLYGLIQGPANEVRPGLRMLSSMTPTLAWRAPRGEVGDAAGASELIVVGGRGGSRIISGVTQVLLSLIVDGDPLQAALGHPRLHHQGIPDFLAAEPDALAPETSQELERRGHAFGPFGTLGRINVARRHADGRVEAAADPRTGGSGRVEIQDPP